MKKVQVIKIKLLQINHIHHIEDYNQHIIVHIRAIIHMKNKGNNNTK